MSDSRETSRICGEEEAVFFDCMINQLIQHSIQGTEKDFYESLKKSLQKCNKPFAIPQTRSVKICNFLDFRFPFNVSIEAYFV